MSNFATSRFRLAWRAWWKDALFLLVVFVLINYLADYQDPGLLMLNPTPALIIPVLIGLWYGFMPGLITGMLVMLAILGFRMLGGDSLDTSFQYHAYSLLALPISGGICGELFRATCSQRDRALFDSSYQKDKLITLDSDVEHLRRVKDQLERTLLKRDTIVFSFDNEIRALYETPPPAFPSALLQSLNRTERIYDAAFYYLEEDQLRLGALIGDASFFPELIEVRQDPLIHAVIETAELAAIPSFLNGTLEKSEVTPYLAGFPLVDDGIIDAVVLIAGMPFVSFERRALRRIDTFCRWAAQILDQRQSATRLRALTGSTDRLVVSESTLIERLALASRTHASLQIPFTALRITTNSPQIDQIHLETILSRSFRAGDTLCVLDESKPNLFLLAPFTGERAEGAIEKRLRSAWSHAGNPVASLQLKCWANDPFDAATVVQEAKKTP